MFCELLLTKLDENTQQINIRTKQARVVCTIPKTERNTKFLVLTTEHDRLKYSVPTETERNMEQKIPELQNGRNFEILENRKRNAHA